MVINIFVKNFLNFPCLIILLRAAVHLYILLRSIRKVTHISRSRSNKLVDVSVVYYLTFEFLLLK